MIEQVKEEVNKILRNDKSSHDMKHINRVLKRTLIFARKEKANEEIASLIALLHDVDDYKIVGVDNTHILSNSRAILKKCGVDNKITELVLKEIATIGYHNRLKGIIPSTIEGKIVSDADMCDVMGATGIIRSYQYNISKGNHFFEENIFPVLNMDAQKYMTKEEETVVTHMFEKLLKLKSLMLTNSGKEEAVERQEIMIQFLYHFFKEEQNDVWLNYLDNYLNNLNKTDLN